MKGWEKGLGVGRDDGNEEICGEQLSCFVFEADLHEIKQYILIQPGLTTELSDVLPVQAE